MGRLKIKKTLFVMHDKDRNDCLKFKTNLLQKMLMTTLSKWFLTSKLNHTASEAAYLK
jgi:hypothetical protein